MECIFFRELLGSSERFTILVNAQWNLSFIQNMLLASSWSSFDFALKGRNYWNVHLALIIYNDFFRQRLACKMKWEILHIYVSNLIIWEYMLNIVQCDTQGSFEKHHQHQSYITTLKASPKSSIGLNRKYIIFEIFQEQSN